MDGKSLISDHDVKISFFQHPAAIHVYEGQVGGRDVEMHGLRLSWLQVNLFECPETAVVPAGSSRSLPIEGLRGLKVEMLSYRGSVSGCKFNAS